MVSKLKGNEFINDKAGWLYELWVISIRNFLINLRLPEQSYVKISIGIAISVIASLMFAGLDGTFGGVRTRNGLMFFDSAILSFCAMQYMCQFFPSERPVFLREYKNNMYSVTSYYFGRYFSEVPWILFIPTL